jgi:hypothetical protein
MLPRFAAKARSDWMEAMFVLMVRAMKISVESSSVQIPSTGDMQIACHRIATPEVHCQIGIKQGPGQRGPAKRQGALHTDGIPCIPRFFRHGERDRSRTIPAAIL